MRDLIEQARQRFRDQTHNPIRFTPRQRRTNDAVICVTLYGKKAGEMIFLPFEKLIDTLGIMQSQAYTAPLPPLSTLMGVELFIIADMIVRLHRDPETETWSGISGGEKWLRPPAHDGVIEHYHHKALYQWQGEVEEENGQSETVSLYEVDYFLHQLRAYLPASQNIIQQIVQKLSALAQYDTQEHQAFYEEIIGRRSPPVTSVGVTH